MKKPTRYMPNVASWLDIVVARLVSVSERINKRNGGTHRFVIAPKDYAKLKAKNPSFRKVNPNFTDWKFLDEATKEFYVVRKKRHNVTVPVRKTKIPFPTEFKATRDGGIHLEQTPSDYRKALYIKQVMSNETSIS